MPPLSVPVDSLLGWLLEPEDMNVGRGLVRGARKKPMNWGTRGCEAQIIAVVISAILS